MASIGVKLGIDGEAEYRKQLNNVIQSTKTLDKQMDALKSSFDDSTDAMEKNQKETELLEKKAEKLNQEVEMMQKMVDAAAEKYGESSTECQKWQQSLAQAQSELNKTNAEIETHQSEASQANSALGQLSSTIDSQTIELEELKEAYINASLEYGENSEQAQALAGQISDLSTELESNQSRLDEVTKAAEGLTSGSGETKSALESLTDEITSQQTELESLRDEYVDAVLEFGEGSEEANELANQIAGLSSELEDNQKKLENARSSLKNVSSQTEAAGEATEDLKEKQEAAGEAAAELAGAFNSSFGNIVGTIAKADVAGLMMQIAEKVIEVIKDLWDMQLEFDEANANIAVATGAIGDNLKKMQNIAVEAWAAVADKDMSEEQFAGIVGNLNTRLGATGEELEHLTEWFGIYAATLDTDGASAVNDFVDVMKKWNMVSDDNAENLQTIRQLMGEFTVAQASADVSVEELAQHLIDQSGTFQELGLGIEDSIGLMVAYRDAGGNVSEITRAMDSVINKLAGETDDLDGCWKSILKTFQNNDSKMAALSTTVGNTGKTLQDVLGAKLAGRIYDTFHSAGVDADAFTAKVVEGGEKQHNALQSSYQASRTDMDKFSQWFKSTFSKDLLSDWTAIEEGAENSNKKIVEATNKAGKEVQIATSDTRKVIVDEHGTVTGILGAPPEIGLSSSLYNLQEAAAAAYANIGAGYNVLKYNLASDPINIKVNAPQIEYQTYGSGNNTTFVPTEVRRQTFAAAYDQAMILSAPTIFGAMGNQLLVGGDRPGNEIVVGEKHLLNMFTAAVRKAGSQPINIVVNAAEGQSEQAIADYVIDRLQMELIGSEAVYA